VSHHASRADVSGSDPRSLQTSRSTAACREPFAAEVYHKNPICGDDVTLRVTLSDDGETVADVSYDGPGLFDQPSGHLGADRAGDRAKRRAGVEDGLPAFTEMVSSRGNIAGDEDVLGDGVAFRRRRQISGPG